MPGKKRILFLTDGALTPLEKIPNCGILCEGRRIIATGGISAFSMDEPGLTIMDMRGTTAMPGFIDSHIHGTAGTDVSSFFEPDDEKFRTLAAALASHGITTFFPTLVASPKEKMLAAISNLAGTFGKETGGALPGGINVEGPFINPEKAGAQKKEFTSPVDLGYARELIEAGEGRIRLMTFAPELEHADKLIELMLENGVIPSMGHSLAGDADTYRAVECGVTRCTHLLNGMPPLHQRKSDLTLIALTDERISVELINDGGHLHPLMVALTCKVKPHDRIIGISNAIDPVASLPFNNSPDTHALTETGTAETAAGLIIGSVTMVDKGWRKLISDSRMDECFATACYTLNPAKNLGLIMRGELRPGKNADIVFTDTASREPVMTVVRGEIVFDKRKSK